MPRAIMLHDDAALPWEMAEDLARLDVAAAPDVEFLATTLPRLLLAPVAMAHRGLAAPFGGFVERAAALPAAVAEACIAAIEQGGLCFAATTATMMAQDPSPLLVEAILRRWPGLAPAAEAMELALVEAVANALIHGNLGIGSSMRISAAGLHEFNRQVAGALEDAALAGRWVVITALPAIPAGIRLSVTDQGAGYAFDDSLSRPLDTTTKSGRGLLLMRQLTDSVEPDDCGRTIRMLFTGRTT